VQTLKAQTEGGLGLSRNNLAAVIMTAGATYMMRALQLAAIGAFRMGIGGERMVRAAHIAPRRRRFSFWNRHGGNPFLNKFTRFCRLGAGMAQTENGRRRR
jgi:hypothetical protein